MSLGRSCVFAFCLATPALAEGVNVVWIIADDLGVDRVGAYAEHPDPGSTPNIDALAQRGVLFRNAWSNPLCSPTRATLLTGRYGFRTGMGTVIRTQPNGGGFGGLPFSEAVLPEVLLPQNVPIALGKWHLAGPADGYLHPNLTGFTSYAGCLRNFADGGGGGVGVGGGTGDEYGYFRWHKTIDGVTDVTEVYATTDTVDDAIAAMAELPEPWFLYVAMNAPHAPVHAPPPHLHGFDLVGEPTDTPIVHVKAMIEALDTELGRLMAQVDLTNTTVVFVGDNGTPGFATDAPFLPEHGKATLYEGGVNVPLIIAGAGVERPGQECAALVNTTDLFATTCELVGVSTDVGTDSVSLVPYLVDPLRESLRDFAYAELFSPNGFGTHNRYGQAMRDRRYKLIWDRLAGVGELYDLELDPFEQRDLMRGRLTDAEEAAFVRLRGAMVALAGE